MSNFATIARQGRANALARIGQGAGTRSRTVGAAPVVSFSSIRGRI